MFIRIFTYFQNEYQIKMMIDEIISKQIESINKVEYITIEPYWKIPGIYKVEVEVDLKLEFTEQVREKFLYSISDKWAYFGKTMEEALASETTEGYNYIKNGINMINIIF